MATKKRGITQSQYKSLEEAFANADFSDSDLAREQERLEEERRRQAVRENFAGVTSEATSTARQAGDESPLLDAYLRPQIVAQSLTDAVQGGVQRSLASALRTETDGDYTGFGLGNRLAQLPLAAEDYSEGESTRALARILSPEQFRPEVIQRLRDAANANQANVDAARRTLDNMNPVAREVGEAALDVAESPLGMLSVFGGPTVAAPLVDTFNQEFDKARSAGLDVDSATAQAAVQAAPELIGFVPAERLLARVPGLNILDRVARDKLSTTAARFATRVGLTSAGEGVGETATSMLQVAANAAAADFAPTEEHREYAKSQLPQTSGELAENAWRSFKAGALAGGGLGAGVQGFRSAAEHGAAVADWQNTVNEAVADAQAANVTQQNNAVNSERLRQAEAAIRNRAPSQPTLFGDADSSLPSFEEQTNARQLDMLYDAQNQISRQQEQARVRTRDAEVQAQNEQQVNSQQLAETRAMQLAETALANPDNPMAQAMAAAALRNPQALAAPVSTETAPEAAVATPVVESVPVQGELAVTQPQARDVALQEATKYVARQDKKALDNAKSRRAASRRQALSAANQQYANLPADQRAERIADTMVAWDSANPVPTAQSISQTATPQAEPAPVVEATQAQPIATQEAVAEPLTEQENSPEEIRAGYRQAFPDATDADLDAMIAEDAGSRPLPMLAPERAGQPLTIEEVGQAVGQQIGRSRGVNAVAELGRSKKLRLISEDSQVPANADARGTAWYTGQDGQIVVDVRKLDRNNVVGDLLDVIAHEAKHAADVSGAGRTTFGEFVGQSANRALNRQIEQAARQGDAKARAAVDAARAGSTTDTYALELPAYYINQMRDGKMTPVGQRIVSAVRTRARDVLGLEGVNLKDVRYLSDKLIEQAAVAPSIAGNIQQVLPLIYNKNSKGFEQALRQGRVYDSVDGNQKYVLTDDDARILPGALESLINTNGDIPLEQVMEHDILYREQPEARNIPITAVDELPGGAFGMYDSGERRIYVSKSELDSGTTGLREALMHEIQHYVQDMGGQSGNFFDGLAAGNPDIEEQFAQVTQANDAASRMVMDQAAAIKSATIPEVRELIDRALFNRNYSDFRKASTIVGIVEGEGMQLPESARRAVNEFNLTLEQYRELQPQVNSARVEQNAAYRSNITEREAFFTQNNVDTPQSGLPINPEQAMRTQEADPETGVDATQGRIDVPTAQSLPMIRLKPAMDAVRQRGTAGHNNVFLNALFGAIDYTGGLGRGVRDQIDTSVGNAAFHAEQARHNMANLERGIDELATRWVSEGKAANKDNALSDVNKMLVARMEALEKIPNVQRRESAIAAFVRDYPELSPMARAYSDVSQLSDSIADQVVLGKDRLTPSDQAFVQKIRDSKFAYTTRLFAALQGPEGRRHSEALLNKAKTAAERMANNRAVSPQQREAYRVYNNAVSYLIDNNLSIPEIEGMQKLSNGRLNDLYDTWMPGSAMDAREIAVAEGRGQGMNQDDADAYASQVLMEELDSKRADLTPEVLKAKADAVIKELLNLNDASSPTAQRVGGLRQDRGILNRRENLPVELRELFGEVKDPVTMLGVTQAKQGELVARTKLLLQLRDAGLLVTKDLAGTPGYEAYTSQISGDSAGPLDGMYTTPRVANAINTSLETFSGVTDGLARAWINADSVVPNVIRGATNAAKWGASKAKAMSIIGEVFNLSANAAGSPITLMANGVINPATILQGGRAGASSVADVLFNGRGDINPLLADGIRYQVVDSARTQELRRAASKYIKNKISEQPRALKGVRQAVGTGWATAVESFAMSDAWTKLAAFQDRVNYLTEFYNAEGVTRTEEDIKTEAGNDIRDSNITYGKTPPILRAGESVGLTTFMPYFYNVPRSLVKSMWLGGQDIVRAKNAKTAEGKTLAAMAGIKRMSGTAAAMAVIPLMTKAIAGVVNGEEDDVEEKKKALRPDARFGDPIYLGEDSKNRPTFFRMSRFDPYGPVTDLVRVALDDNITADQAADTIVKNISGMIFTNRFVQAAASAAGDPITSDSRIERISPEATGVLKRGLSPVLGYNGSRAAMRVLDSLMPGMADTLDPNNSATIAPKDELSSAIDALTRFTGGRVDRADPSSLARQAAFEIRERRNTARAELFDAVNTRASDTTIESIIRDANKDVYKNMNVFADLYEGMTKGMGISPAKAMDVLKTEGKLNSVEIANARKGLPKSYEAEDLVNELGGVLSKRSLEQRSKKATREKTDEETKQYEQEIKQLLARLRKDKGLKAGD